MRPLIVLLALFALSGSLPSQTLDIVWTQIYDFKQNPDDWYGINDGVFTSDSHVVLIGAADLNGYDGQVFILKVDMQGDTVWSKTLGGPLTHDVGMDITETADGNLMALGTIQFEGNAGRVRLYKMTPQGEIIWEKTYLAETEYAIPHGIAETSSGGFIISGESELDMFIFKTDSTGDSLWVRYLGDDYYDTGGGIAPTVDGGAIVTGYLSTADVKWDSLLVVRIDSLGNDVWTKTFPVGGGQYYYVGPYIYEDAEGHYIVTTVADTSSVYSYKLDAEGTVLWSSELNSDPYASVADICEGGGKSTYLVGHRGSDVHTLVGKIDSLGDSLFLTDVILPESSSGNFIFLGDGGYIYIGGRLHDTHTIYFAKLKENPPADVADDDATAPFTYRLSQNYPNPFNPATHIPFRVPSRSHVSLEIFNIGGQRIITLLDETKPAGEYRISWGGVDSFGREVSTGMYLYRFRAGDITETKKMLLLR